MMGIMFIDKILTLILYRITNWKKMLEVYFYAAWKFHGHLIRGSEKMLENNIITRVFVSLPYFYAIL